MAGTFQVESSFTVNNRGLVVAGQILDGTLRIGGRVLIPSEPGGQRNERITGLGALDGRRKDGTLHSAVSLLLSEVPPGDIPALCTRLTPGLILSVEDPEAGYRPPEATRREEIGRASCRERV